MIYIISDWIDESSLDKVWDSLSVHDKDDICQQLREIIRTLRQVCPLDQHYVGAVGCLPCTDSIIFDQGPFKDIPTFNAALTETARPYFWWNLLSVVERSLARTGLFSHMATSIPPTSWSDSRLPLRTLTNTKREVKDG